MTLTDLNKKKQAHGSNGLQQDGLICVLGKQVGRIVGTKHFMESRLFVVELFLNPKVGDIQVPYAAHAAPTSDAYSGCRVAVKVDSPVNTEVARDALKAQCLGKSVTNTAQLCLATGEADGRLRLAPVLAVMGPM